MYFCFYVVNGNVKTFQTDNMTEIERLRCQYGQVFNNRLDAINEAKKPPKKVRELTDIERKEQYEWALAMMTEEEKADVAMQKKTRSLTEMSLFERDLEQLKFARQMEHWSKREYSRKLKAFLDRTQYERKVGAI